MRKLALNVKSLPDHGFGHTDPLWWGIMGMIAIEGTVFALLIASYYFLRGNFATWPTVGMPPHERLVSTIGVGLIVASAVPMYLVNQAALRMDFKAVRRWLTVNTILAAAFLFFRYLEIKGAPIRWDEDSYGSLLWSAWGLHTVHGITGVLENCVFLVLLFRGPIERKHYTDLQVNGTYWYFVVASWVVLYGVFFLDPGQFNR